MHALYAEVARRGRFLIPSPRVRTPHPPFPRHSLPWVSVGSGCPYFQTEDGSPWHPLGQNDAISWRELNPLFRRRDVPAVRAYLAMLRDHGVTCMRLMLEYAQVRHRYFETAPGKWGAGDGAAAGRPLHALRGVRGAPAAHSVRHVLDVAEVQAPPYNVQEGGPLAHPSRMLLCRETRVAIKARLTFAVERWGGSGALFAWDLWNEIHPAQAEMSAEPFHEFILDLSTHVQELELRTFGRAHPRTVSLFGPQLEVATRT